ncbi:MAG: twin-arginine translocase TatA/TatE family subunit [Planctomycetales bacterium]
MTGLLAMFMPGWTELLIVGLIVLLLFGKRLPTVMRSLGTSIVEFKKGVKGIEDDMEANDLRTESRAEQKRTEDRT